MPMNLLDLFSSTALYISRSWLRVYSHRARELPLAITLGKEYIDFNGIIHTKVRREALLLVASLVAKNQMSL